MRAFGRYVQIYSTYKNPFSWIGQYYPASLAWTDYYTEVTLASYAHEVTKHE